jgi:hypothetical protein
MKEVPKLGAVPKFVLEWVRPFVLPSELVKLSALRDIEKNQQLSTQIKLTGRHYDDPFS